jgi:aspartyl/glutamyl-tRNA(Asn/Gln) amidotransferase C subunit
MKMSIEELKDLATRLKFDMSEEEYKTLQEEFEVILSQMELLGNIKGLDDVEPMTFPYAVFASLVREDEVGELMSYDEIFSNIKNSRFNQIRVPKVVQ